MGPVLWITWGGLWNEAIKKRALRAPGPAGRPLVAGPPDNNHHTKKPRP